METEERPRRTRYVEAREIAPTDMNALGILRGDIIPYDPETIIDQPPHVHEWKRADDWDWGPGTVTYECHPCRSLRVVHPVRATSPPRTPRRTGMGSEPVRIRRSRSAGWRLPAGAVIVTRPSRWGNPYRVERTAGPATRRGAVERFRAYAMSMIAADPDWLAPLQGRDLACWCPLDQPCHADVLLELANQGHHSRVAGAGRVTDPKITPIRARHRPK